MDPITISSDGGESYAYASPDARVEVPWHTEDDTPMILHLIVSEEGIIVDGIEEDEVVQTMCMLWDDIVERMQ
jgi:hypothetical protein